MDIKENREHREPIADTTSKYQLGCYVPLLTSARR